MPRWSRVAGRAGAVDGWHRISLCEGLRIRAARCGRRTRRSAMTGTPAQPSGGRCGQDVSDGVDGERVLVGRRSAHPAGPRARGWPAGPRRAARCRSARRPAAGTGRGYGRLDPDRAGPLLAVGAARCGPARRRAARPRPPRARRWRVRAARVRPRPTELRVVGERRPDLRRVEPEREPGGDPGEPVGRRAGERRADLVDRLGRRRPGAQRGGEERDHVRQVARTASPRGSDGGRLGPPDHDPGRDRPPTTAGDGARRTGDEHAGRRDPASPDQSSRCRCSQPTPEPAQPPAGSRRPRAAAGAAGPAARPRPRRTATPTAEQDPVVTPTSSASRAIVSIHHSPASPKASPSARQASPGGVPSRNPHGSPPAPEPISRASTGRPGHQPGRGPRRGQLARDHAPGGGGGPQRLGDPVDRRRQALAGAVARPARRPRRPAGRGRRRGRRRGARSAAGTSAPTRKAAATGASAGQAAAARSRHSPGGLAGGELAGHHLAGLEHPGRADLGRLAAPLRRRPGRLPRARRRRATTASRPTRGTRAAVSRRRHQPSQDAGRGGRRDRRPPGRRAAAGRRTSRRRRPAATTAGRDQPTALMPPARSGASRAAAARPGPGRPSRPSTSSADAIATSPSARRSGTATCRRPAYAVAAAGEVEHDVDGRGELAVGGVAAQAGGEGERLDPGRDVDGGVGVQGAAAALVAGVERGQQVDDLARRAPRRPRAGRAASAAPAAPGCAPRPRRRPRGWRAGPPARRRADGRDAARWRPRPRRAAPPGPTRASSAASRVVLPEPVPPLTRNASRGATIASSSRATSAGRACRAPTSSSRVKTRRRGTRSEITRARPRQRRQHGVEAGAVGQPEVDVRRGVVEPAPAERGQPLGEPADGLLVGEPDAGQLEPGAAVEVDVVRPVDQHVGDVRGRAAAARAGRRRRRRGAASRRRRAPRRRRPGARSRAAPRRPGAASARRGCGRAGRGPPPGPAARHRTGRSLMRPPACSSASWSSTSPAARPSAPRRERTGPSPRSMASARPRWSAIAASTGDPRWPGRSPAGRCRRRAPPAATRPGSGCRAQIRTAEATPATRRDDDDEQPVAPGRELVDHGVGGPRQVDDHEVVAALRRREHLAHRERLQAARLPGAPGQRRRAPRAAAAPRAATGR